MPNHALRVKVAASATMSAGIITSGQVRSRENSTRVTAETMLEAHENLVKLSPENLPKFKDVLTFLREDLKATQHDGQKPKSPSGTV